MRALCLSLLLVANGLLPVQAVETAFFDPMRPPPFALEKLRQERIKKTAIVKPAQPRAAIKNPWVLSSILYSGQRQHAIINNRLVRKGEMIQGAKLIRLRPDGVRLMVKGKIVDLSLYDKDTKDSFKSIKKSLNEKKI